MNGYLPVWSSKMAPADWKRLGGWVPHLYMRQEMESVLKNLVTRLLPIVKEFLRKPSMTNPMVSDLFIDAIRNASRHASTQLFILSKHFHPLEIREAMKVVAKSYPWPKWIPTIFKFPMLYHFADIVSQHYLHMLTLKPPFSDEEMKRRKNLSDYRRIGDEKLFAEELSVHAMRTANNPNMKPIKLAKPYMTTERLKVWLDKHYGQQIENLVKLFADLHEKIIDYADSKSAEPYQSFEKFQQKKTYQKLLSSIHKILNAIPKKYWTAILMGPTNFRARVLKAAATDDVMDDDVHDVIISNLLEHIPS